MTEATTNQALSDTAMARDLEALRVAAWARRNAPRKPARPARVSFFARLFGMR